MRFVFIPLGFSGAEKTLKSLYSWENFLIIALEWSRPERAGNPFIEPKAGKNN